MYNHQNPAEHKQHHQQPPPISPRISFSNDFVESSSSSSQSHSHPHGRHHHGWPPPAAASSYRDAPVSSDFEFSVSNYSMMSADELFFKGRLLPLKETKTTTTTLRDELQNNNNEDDDEDMTTTTHMNNDFSLRPPKNPTRWRGFLGLKKAHIGSKKSGEKRPPAFNQHDDNNLQCSNKNSQEYVD